MPTKEPGILHSRSDSGFTCNSNLAEKLASILQNKVEKLIEHLDLINVSEVDPTRNMEWITLKLQMGFTAVNVPLAALLEDQHMPGNPQLTASKPAEHLSDKPRIESR